VRNEQVLNTARRKGICYKQQDEGRLTGLVTSYVGTAFYTGYCRKDRRKNRSDWKTRKKK